MLFYFYIYLFSSSHSHFLVWSIFYFYFLLKHILILSRFFLFKVFVCFIGIKYGFSFRRIYCFCFVQNKLLLERLRHGICRWLIFILNYFDCFLGYVKKIRLNFQFIEFIFLVNFFLFYCWIFYFENLQWEFSY